MKNQISKAGRSFIKGIVIVVAIISVLRAPQAQANDSSSAIPEPTIRYEGMIDGRPAFSVSYTSKTNHAVVISITDEEGFVLYNERTEKSSYSKKFAVELNDAAPMKLAVTLSDTKGRLRRVYQVVPSTSTVHDIVVTRL